MQCSTSEGKSCAKCVSGSEVVDHADVPLHFTKHVTQSIPERRGNGNEEEWVGGDRADKGKGDRVKQLSRESKSEIDRFIEREREGRERERSLNKKVSLE